MSVFEASPFVKAEELNPAGKKLAPGRVAVVISLVVFIASCLRVSFPIMLAFEVLTLSC